VPSERIEARTILWAAGVAASPAAKWLQANADRAGRVLVGPDLTLPGHSEIFVIGDTAAAVDVTGKPLPGVASVAKQQGIYVARVVRARLKGVSSAPSVIPPPAVDVPRAQVDAITCMIDIIDTPYCGDDLADYHLRRNKCEAARVLLQLKTRMLKEVAWKP
jgi:NADH dehydrogenase FAD-containing subunit